MDCKKCIFHTRLRVIRPIRVYSAIHEREIILDKSVIVPACGKYAGTPVEIPADRVACADCKELIPLPLETAIS